jgi:hypothetical protein
MRKFFILILLLSSSIASAADFSLSIGSPNLRIGVNVSDYPRLVAIPGYPVYYAPQMNSNYFFYDGLYWVYQDDSWYASSWYNGPWSFVDPYAVPVYVLRVPVRYYRQPPVYFRGWAQNSAPRWGDHWGGDWREHRHGWDKWNRRATPKPLPLPAYQRQYSGDRYPDADHQRDLQRVNYRYQPRNATIAQHYQHERNSNDQWRSQSQQERERAANDRREQSQRDEQQQQVRRQENQRQLQEQQIEQQRQRDSENDRSHNRGERSKDKDRRDKNKHDNNSH